MTRPNHLIQGLAHHLHELPGIKFLRNKAGGYLVSCQGTLSPLDSIIGDIAEDIGVSPELLITALETMQHSLPTRSIAP